MINTATNQVVTTIMVGPKPLGLAVTPDGTKVYVAFSGVLPGDPGGLAVIDAASNTVATTIRTGQETTSVAVSPNGACAYAYVGSMNNVDVISTATNAIVKVVQLGPSAESPGAIALSPDGNFVWVAVLGSPKLPPSPNQNGSIYVVSASSDQLVKTIPVKGAPNDVTFSPDGKQAFIPNMAVASMMVIDASSYAVTASIGVGNLPTGSAVSPDGTRLYALAYEKGSITVINTSTDSVVSVIQTGMSPNGIVATSNGKVLYITVTFSSSVSGGGQIGQVWAYDAATGARISSATISVGDFPAAIAYQGLLTGCCP